MCGVQGIGKARLRASGAEWFLLAFMGRPTGQENDLERRTDATGLVGKAVLVDGRRPREQGPRRRGSVPRVQGVGFAHGAQIAHQGEDVPVADSGAQRIGNRQGKARPLQQCTHLPNLGHRRHTGAEPAGRSDFSLRQGDAQLVECFTAECRAEEQAIGGQRTAALHDLAHRVIRPVKRHGMDHQIMRALLQVEHVIGRDTACAGGHISPKIGEGCDDRRRRKRSVNVPEPFLDLVSGTGMKKTGVVQSRTCAVPGKRRFIHKLWAWLRDRKGQGFARPVH
jgi:hypothetical protein